MRIEPASRVFELPADEVHVWYVFSDGLTDPHVLASYAALMNAEERSRHERFVFAKDRHQFLVTRGFVRTLIGRYADIAPADCAFVSNRYGRPSVRHKPDTTPEVRLTASAEGYGGPPELQRRRKSDTTSDFECDLEFNVSHTPGLIACAVALGREVGIDVEDLERMEINPDLPQRYFSRAEVEALGAVPPQERTSRFFDYWTLKEAYIKARGMGLSLPLDGFALHLHADRAPRISFDASVDDDPSSWQFAQFDPSPRYRMALAVRRRGPDLAVRIRPFDQVS